MKFLCLAYGSEADWKKLTPAEQNTLLAADQRIRDRRAFMSAVENHATTVTARDGTPKTDEHPFATSRVPLAGFSIIEADDIDDVVRLVADTPCARAGGAIEIRPLLDTSPH
ncbi:YciI family protein [Cognatilysobacter terrigena]|uniref:YciI family protein n=1 Tax=Cognatilysobacter terrigena TaxID=2488749 RepID=UPI00106166EB|nr:YciI family protein [Lysobacter terrigena]